MVTFLEIGELRMPTAEIDKELVAALNAAKSKSHNFAIVVKGASVVHLLVSKSPIKEAELLKAKKEHGGTRRRSRQVRGPRRRIGLSRRRGTGTGGRETQGIHRHGDEVSVKPHFEISTEVTGRA